MKCPYSVKTKSPEEIAMEGKFHIFRGNDKSLHLKSSSPWYTQVQAHLFVTGYSFCDFVLVTQKSPYIMIERIYFDKEFYNITKKALLFYDKYIFTKTVA